MKLSNINIPPSTWLTPRGWSNSKIAHLKFRVWFLHTDLQEPGWIMEGAHSTQRIASNDNFNDTLPSHTRRNVDPQSSPYQPSYSVTMENRVTLPLPTALSSMLRNTTEMGDIGLFAVKSSRLPHRLISPRQTGGAYGDHCSHTPQQDSRMLNGMPFVDDRKRLPSYTRDATSEIVSMYETASQKATGRSKALDEPDCRSYSMMQTSYPEYPLTNHRSYTSLHSQPELNLMHRPRSPFPYPARLKRLGFRPSSPVLTDGGYVDCTLRADVDRMPIVSLH